VGELSKIEALPTLVVIDRDGRIRNQLHRVHHQGALERAVSEAAAATVAGHALRNSRCAS
jgi:hypothetical protein